MKHRVPLILVCGGLTALILADCQPAGWREFKSAEGAFSISVPSAPKKSKQTVNTAVGPVIMYMFVSKFENIEYGISYGDFPEFIRQDPRTDQMLDGGRDGAVANIKGKLLSEIRIAYGKHPGRELQVATPDGVHILKARMLLVGNRMYQLMVVTTKEDTLNETVTQFLDSFTLTEEE